VLDLNWKGTIMTNNEPISGTTSGDKNNAQNHDKVEGDVEVDKPSQAEGDADDTTE
jgi:hypothetical protein